MKLRPQNRLNTQPTYELPTYLPTYVPFTNSNPLPSDYW